MFTLKMLIRSDIWIRLKHISSTLSTSQGPFLTNWRWAPSSVWSPHFDVHVTFTFSFWGLIANIFLFCCMRVFFTLSFWGQILLFLDLGPFIHFPFFLWGSHVKHFSYFGSPPLVLNINVPIEYPNLNVSFILPRWQEVSSFLSSSKCLLFFCETPSLQNMHLNMHSNSPPCHQVGEDKR